MYIPRLEWGVFLLTYDLYMAINFIYICEYNVQDNKVQGWTTFLSVVPVFETPNLPACYY